MKCEELKRILFQDELGKLPDAVVRDFKEHLAHCRDCREEAREMEKVWEILEILGEEEVPPEVTYRLNHKLGEAKRAHAPWFEWFLKPTAAAWGFAVLLIVLVGGLWLSKYMFNPSSQMVSQVETINLEPFKLGQLKTSWKLEEMEETEDNLPAVGIGHASSPLMDYTEDALTEYLKEGG